MTTLSAWYRGKRIELPVADVTRFVSGDKYVTAHHAGGETILSVPLARLAEDHPEFIRVHRGMLIRRSCLLGIQRNPNDNWEALVTFQDQPVPVGPTHHAEVSAWLNQRGAA